jgi:hypothetical protein
VTGAGTGRRRPESREELLARVAAEQQGLHPLPAFTPRARRRLTVFLVAIWPVSFAVAVLTGWLLGWSTLEWVSFAVGLVFAFGYLGYLLIAERDDGRIDRSTRALVRDAGREPAGEDPPGA